MKDRTCARPLITALAVMGALIMVVGFFDVAPVSSLSAWAKDAERSRPEPRGTQGALTAPALRSGDLYALVVGISQYPNDKIGNLNRAHTDAQDFAEFLKTQGKVFKNLHVTLLVNEQATRKAVETYLKYKLKKALKGDTIVIFLSGHGSPDPARPADFYFVTYDADPEFLGASAVKMSGLEFAREYEAERVLLIADACHAGGFSFMQSGTATKSLGPAIELFLREIKESSGIAAIMSSKPGESSWDLDKFRNSVFTHFLLEGLKGRADRDHNGVVTLEEAYQYAYKHTKEETRGAQTPQRAAGDVVGSFPLSFVGSGTPKEELQAHLLHAAKSGNLRKVKELLDDGVYVNARDRSNNTPLILASKQGRVDVVRHLLKCGAGVDDSNNLANRALTCAAENGHAEVVEMLLGAGANVDAENNKGEKALTRAAREGHAAVVRLLVEKGANIKARTHTGNTALSLAAYRGHREIVAYLLSKGADVNAVDTTNRTALSLAARYGHSDIVKLLAQHGAFLDASHSGKTAKGPAVQDEFMRAVLLGDDARLPVLLERGARIDFATDSGDTALTLAAGLGHLDAVKTLLAKGVAIDASTTYHSTALMWASYNGRPDVVRVLLTRGADYNRQDKGGWTALMYASQNGHTSIVMLLTSKGAAIETAGKDGDTALSVAAEKGRVDIVKHLLAKGANPNAKKSDGSTALILAARNGHSEVVQLLSGGGANLNAAREDGNTALIMAAQQGHPGVVKYLLNKGADPNAKNEKGSTPLIQAAREGHVDVVRLLLASGARTDLQDWEGMTASRIASVGGHTGIAQLLDKASSK